MWYPILAINNNLLQVKGRGDVILRIEIIKKIIGIIVLCVTIRGGVVAICYGQVLSALIFVGINTYVSGRIVGVGFVQQMRDVMSSLLLSIAMWWVVRWTSATVDGGVAKLAVGLFSGVIFYVGGAYAVQSKDLKMIISLLRGVK